MLEVPLLIALLCKQNVCTAEHFTCNERKVKVGKVVESRMNCDVGVAIRPFRLKKKPTKKVGYAVMETINSERAPDR